MRKRERKGLYEKERKKEKDNLIKKEYGDYRRKKGNK